MKSKLVLSNKFSNSFHQSICVDLGVSSIPKDKLYLGVSLPFERKKIEMYQCIIQRMYKKMSSWSDHALSKAGKLLMIQVVLQTLSTYVMSCLKLPKRICNALTSYIRKFWWNNDPNKLDKHCIN